MNKLTDSCRAAVVRALVKGNSVRSTARLTGTAKATVLKLLVELGDFCSIYQYHALRDLPTKRVECDEIWAYTGAKQKNATKPGQGDLWTFTAIDADSKLIFSWLVGQRVQASAQRFVADVASRLANRVQLTTDGHPMYLTAVENAFVWAMVDFAQLVKTYAASSTDVEASRRYSPAVSLYFMFYNYCRPHQTLTKAANGIKTTPAIAAGITDHVWTVEEILELMSPTHLLH